MNVTVAYLYLQQAYLNGDGLGRGKCISLFFVLMRGEYDELLQFPFKQRVTFSLICPTNPALSKHETFMVRPAYHYLWYLSLLLNADSNIKDERPKSLLALPQLCKIYFKYLLLFLTKFHIAAKGGSCKTGDCGSHISEDNCLPVFR